MSPTSDLTLIRPNLNIHVGPDLASYLVGHDTLTPETVDVYDCYEPPVMPLACCNADVATANLPNTAFEEAEKSLNTKALTAGTNTLLTNGPNVMASTDDC